MVMMLASRLRTARPVAQQTMQRRRAGGFSADMAVKKNKFMEEWNGKREITEKTFEVGTGNALHLLIYLGLVPYGIYTWSRSELLNRGDRRYKEVV